MTRREARFLLIGLGAGLMLAVALVIEFVLWFHHMFIVGFRWRPESLVLAVPFLLVLFGSILLHCRKNEQYPN
ncbi:MAG TPA: hypothetical protein VG225_14310 [Terracidiphilus sp.]|jgi:hypothetical protein|nr:hypothetical protein [Terracidiphilus sp.]